MNLEELDKKFRERERYYVEHYFRGFFREIYLFFRYKPYRIYEDSWLEVKWGFQRMFRGYDDRLLWGYPHQNARITVAVLKKLQKHKRGYPIIDRSDILLNYKIHPDAQRKWNVALGKIIQGFEAFIKEDGVFITGPDGKYDHGASKVEGDKLLAKWKEGSELFIKYYGNLWD